MRKNIKFTCDLIIMCDSSYSYQTIKKSYYDQLNPSNRRIIHNHSNDRNIYQKIVLNSEYYNPMIMKMIKKLGKIPFRMSSYEKNGKSWIRIQT